MSTRVSLYGGGLFNDPPPPGVPYATQIQQLNGAGFTTVVLWSIHVDPKGDLYFNDTLMVQNGVFQLGADFVANVKALVAGGVEELLISIGAWSTQSDFTNLQQSWNSGGATNLQTLIATLPITAVDFDYEGDYDAAAQSLIVDLTQKIAGLGVGVTYCPYTAADFWMACLQTVYANSGQRQPVQYLNLQCYAGGAGNDPADWVTAVGGANAGVANPGAFVVPGYWVASNDGSTCPTALQATLAGAAQSGITGAFLWNSDDLFTNENAASSLCNGESTMPDAYAQAIRSGLGGTSD